MHLSAPLAIMTSAILVAACGAGWTQQPLPTAGPLEVRQQVQVWASDGMHRWHAVEVSTDTISGVPYVEEVTCGSCRVALPRSAVDSLRFGEPTKGFWKSIALVFGIGVGAMMLLYWPA